MVVSPSLAGNIMATAFPLFTHQIFHALGYRWANTIFGFIAVVMIPIPYVRNLLQDFNFSPD